MANTVIALRSSGVASNVPNVSSLANGEVAINFADGILYYKTDTGSLGTIQTAQPSGLDTEIQFNDSGSFGGDSGLTYNKTTNALTVAGNLTSANVTSQSYIQFGDGTRQYTANAGGTAAVTSVAGATGAVSNTQILTGLLTVDGSGSGLDADTVDGIQGSAIVTTTTITNYSINPRFSTTIGFGNDTEILFFNDATNQTRTGYWSSKDGFEVRGDSNSKDAVVLQTGNLELTQNAYITGILGTGGAASFGSSVTIASNLTVDTSTLHVDATNNRVGIGTTTPQNPLDVTYSSSSTDLTTGPGNPVSTGIRVFNTNSTSNAYSYVDLRTNNGDVRLAGINRGSNLSDFAILTDNGSGLVEGMRVTSTQNIGIGTTSPAYKLEVNGSFAATTKSFVIPHPTKKGKKLRYGSLEGPENGVYVRGQTTERIIKLPAYWTKLVDSESITVNLVSVGEYQQLYVEKIEKNKVYIKNAAGKNINCFYTIFAERVDVEKLEVEI